MTTTTNNIGLRKTRHKPRALMRFRKVYNAQTILNYGSLARTLYKLLLARIYYPDSDKRRCLDMADWGLYPYKQLVRPHPNLECQNLNKNFIAQRRKDLGNDRRIRTEAAFSRPFSFVPEGNELNCYLEEGLCKNE
uniref:Uncharacterized protein n=1 Tax=Romanomermis culicivorax TaxID=13658 RepID=A0A915HUM3_ROMCU